MELEVAASESSVMQKDDDSYPSDTIAEQAGNQHALLKTPKYMDKKEEDISGDASEEVYISPETTSETIKACCPETGIKLTAPFISSVDDTQNTHDDIRHDIPSAEKETAEYGSDEMENENFAKQNLPPITEKSIEQPFYEESHEAGDNSAQLKAEDDSSMKTAEIIQVKNTHIPLTADQEDKSPQDLSYEKESDNEGMSPEDAQQISEEISESRNNVSCADVAVESTSEPQQSYQEVLQPSQIIFKGANDSKENANDNSNDKEVTTSTEEMLVDSSSAIEDSSKKTESEIYESNTIRSEDGAHVDQLAEHATIEATEKSSQVGLAAVTGPANIEENDEHQTCQTEVEENETISEMIKQNQIFQESDLQEKNVISTESISYDNAIMTKAAMEGDNDERVELKAEEIGYSFEEENVETATREPYSSDQISSTDEISVPFSEKGDSAISNDSDKVSNLNDNGNMESIDTEAKLDMMQEVENKREIVVETASDDITEEINDESYMVSENQVDNLTNKATEEPDLIAKENQENSIHNDAIGPDGDAQSTFTNIEPTSRENHEVKIDEIMEESVSEIEQKKIENEEFHSVRDVTSAEENLEDGTNSAAAENGDDQNENQSLNVTCVQTRTEAEDTINKTDDSEKEVDLQYTEETQSTREATKESFQSAITDEMEDDKNLENINADPSQEHDEINHKNSNYDEESNEYKVQESNEVNELHLEDESKTEEAKTQVYEEESSSNKEGIRTVEVSQSQDECSEVYEDSIHVTEVEDTTDKQHEEQEDRSPYGEHDDGVLADQVKAMNAGVDSQNENELNTSNSAGVHVQEDQTERESCKYDEMDESDTRKDKDIIAQEFEQDNLVNAITSQESSPQTPPIEPLEHNLGAAMDDPTVSQPSENVDDETISVEASQAVGLEAEQLIKTNEDPKQENDISADTIIQGDSADELQHITNSAIGYENSTTFAEADKHGSADHLKIVDCKDDEHAENLQESESENQGLATKEVDTAIEANKDDNFDQEFQETNANPMELSENTGTESDNIEVQNDRRDDEEGVYDDTAKTVPVTDPKIEDDLSTGIPYQSGKPDQEIYTDNPVTSRDEGTGESSEAMQVVDFHEEVSTDCRVSPKEVIPIDAGTDIQQKNESSAASMDCKQDQEDEFFKNSKMDESHPEKDIELINQGFEQDSISSEMPCQKTSAAIEALRQDIGTAMDDHTQNEPSEIANDSKKADFETEQHNQTDEEPEHENEISAEEDMSIENRELVPESAEQAEENDTENETINRTAEDLGSNTVEDSGNENTNLEISQKEINTEDVRQDMDVVKRELIPESTKQREENNAEETINSRTADLSSNTVEDLSGGENTNLEISEKVINLDEDPKVNTEVTPQDVSFENRELIPESVESIELTGENNIENEAVNSIAKALGSNTVEDIGNENTNLEVSQKEISLNENPTVNTDDVLQGMDVESYELIPESTELREENTTENEAINSKAADLGSNTVEDLSGNENTNSEMSQKVTNLEEDPRVDTEVVPQDEDVGDHEIIPESTENNTENEAINSKADELGSNTIEDSSGKENTNLEISQKEIGLNEDPIVETEGVLQDMDVENHKFIPESTELIEENNTENEAINSKAEESGPNTAADLGGIENTNSEVSQKVTSLDEDPKVNTEAVPQDMSVEDRELVPGSGELAEENDTDNETINRRAEDLGSNTVEDSGNENTNLEISQKKINTEDVRQDMDVVNRELIPESTKQREENNAEEAINSRTSDLSSNTVEDLSGGENTNLEISEKVINLDEDPKVNTEVTPQDVSFENRALVPESAELTEENNTENEAINSRAEDLGSNTVEDIGNENTNLEVSQKEISLNENPTVDTDVVLQGMDVESYELIPESTELREENSTENEAIKCRTVGLGSNTVEDLSGNENTNSEISQKLTNLDGEKNTEVMPQVMDVENLELIPESTELIEENNTENEAINSKAEESGPKTAGDLGENENTNSEISQKEINLDEDPIVKTMEKIQDDEELENTEREITQEGSDSQHTLAEERTIDQEKPIGTADTPRLENEETTCMYDEEIQEVKETHEQCKFNEMNESVSFKNKEIESQGFEDDCTSKRIQNEQTPMHSEASAQNVVAEIASNQDNEESRIDASEEINRQEVAEHDEHRNEALLDKISEQEVTCSNASSSENEMDTSAEQTTEPPLEISQTNNADQGPELGVYEQSIEGNEEEDELDSNKPKFNAEMVVNPIEESQHEDDRDDEINGQPIQTQSENGISTAIEPNEAKQDGNVSTVTKSYIDGHRIDEITLDETVQTQGKQSVEPEENFLEPSSPSEATSTAQGKEDCSMTLQDLNKEKEEDPTPEKATQRELCGDLPYKPAVEDVSKTEEYLVPEAQGANDPLDNEKMEPCSSTISYSHEIKNDADQFQHDSQQTVRVSCADEPSIKPVSENYGHTSEEVTENQEETKSPEQLIESNNEEQTMEDIIDGSGCQAVKSEMTVEESKSEENYGPHGTSAYDSTDEKQVAAGSIEIVERSSEPVPFKESKKDEDKITEEKEETSADAESQEPELHKIDNDADRDEKTLSSTECNTKSDECSITISKDSKEISEEPQILVTSTSLEGEAVGENFQQSTSEERTENEVSLMEPKMDASELLHQMNVPKPDNMDDEKEKQQESANGLECCSTLESQHGNDRILFTEMEVPEDLSSREIDSSHSEAKLKVDEMQSEGKFPNESDVHMDCQEEEKISAAEIIASHICREIETEEKLKQPTSEHQNQIPETSMLVTDANDTTFEEEVLHEEESTENSFGSFDNPTKIVRAPEEREIEHPSLEVEPDRELEQKQDLNEELRTMDNSVRTDPNELSSEFQGVESSAEVESDTEDSTLERLNFKEVSHLNEKRETEESSQLNFKSQPISGENLVNSCEISEEIGNDTQLQTVKNELMGESSPSKFEVYEAVVTDAAGEQEMHNVNTTVSSEDGALEQPPLPTTKSCDETKKSLIADEHSANTTFSVSQVSGINNTPPTETNATEEKVSEEQPMKKVSNHDSDIPQTMQIDNEEQLQANYDDLHQSSRLQELCGKDSVNMRIDEPVDKVDVIYNGMNVENFTKEGSVSSTNEVPSLEPVQSLTKSKEEITDEKYNETEEKPMLPSIIDEKKSGEWVVVSQNLLDDEKRAADEPKTEKDKEDTENDHGEEDSELIPMISETSRDIELKTQNKKSLHILSGMGSKMKNSISKVKKAMACASPQFSPDDVIIKLNKSKKS